MASSPPHPPPPSRTARILLHSAAAAIMISGYHNLTKLPINAFISTQYGGHLQYLTIQGLFITCATTLISLLMDLFPSVNGKSSLKPLKRILLIIAMPLSITISSIYWPLLLLATQLILQNGSGEPSSSPHAPQPLLRIPLPMDLSLHAVPALTLLIDFLLFEKKYTRKEIRYGGTGISVVYTIFYAWWVERCAGFNGGRFPYPFLTDNPFEIRLAIYVGAGMLAFSSFWLINRVHA
ncbi:FAR-17a/AIG1-like protein [Lentinula edodes]|uniref:FAR-17a/AIG1-like protein n=1 Tax=Lentinula lateritia TaxID=40482 RepID=A0A9W9AE29_9AGAR|nr:FAR-17a/AIG1-like protein [Lentinula edodes]